jgi:DNA-binding NtrC family response regulator
MTTKQSFQLLLVDDDQLVAQALHLCLPDYWKMTWLRSFESPLKSSVHCALVDIHINGKPEGLNVIRDLKTQHPQLPVIAISGDLSMPLMEECIRLGASRFLAKPIDREELRSHLEKTEALWLLRSRESKGTSKYAWIGNSPASELVKLKIASMRGESGPILIYGETGSGKEVTARLLNAQEMARPFVAVNMASVAENLFESEMFGHVKGAFTGADVQKIGLIEATDGGDLFLDEIDALSLTNQAKLLRFIETQEYRKVGSKDLRFSNCRILAATNKDLSKLVQAGEFREDLMFRLSGKVIKLPALRDRFEDLIPLTDYFLKNSKQVGQKQILPETLELMSKYSWPGNVRELKRICEQLLISSPLPFIRAQDAEAFLSQKTNQNESEEDITMGLPTLLENFERKVIIAGLKKVQDVESAATLLKVSRSNLYKKIKDLNINM